MNTELMSKVQTLIYSNQDKLEQLVEALESVCNESNITVTPEPVIALKHPLEDYTVSEKDIGSLVFIEGRVSPKPVTHRLLDDDYVFRNHVGVWYKDDFKPYIDTIKLHFKPFYATKDSEMPSELKDGVWVAVLLDNGVIYISEDASDFIWRSGNQYDTVGYQVLSFVNPVLDK